MNKHIPFYKSFIHINTEMKRSKSLSFDVKKHNSSRGGKLLLFDFYWRRVNCYLGIYYL